MSRGTGRVQRGILAALSRGALDTYTLTLYAGASEESTRRALRTLRRAGQVACLGFAGRGGAKWCLAEDEAEYRDVWPVSRQLHLTSVMGSRYAASFRRLVVSAL